MAYVPDFEYDVFISYAHVDNLDEDAAVAAGWVDRFHRALEVGLVKRVGRMGVLNVWRDDALGGNQLFDDAIRERLERTAVLVVLCSPGYLASDYCRHERECFWRAALAGRGTRAGERSRVANVLLYDIPHAQWPQELTGTSGFPFYETPQTGAIGAPAAPGSDGYRAGMRALVHDVFALLEALRPPRTARAADDAADVFLAEVSDKLRVARTRLAADLARSGLRVVDGIPPPHDAFAHDDAVERALGRARLSVHLFDELGGAPVAGSDDDTYPRRQWSLAARAGARRLVWLPAELADEAVEDPVHREFVKGVANAPRDEESYELVRIPRSDLAGVVGRALERQRAAAVAPPPGGPPAVLLDTHLKDQALAFDLGQRLLARSVLPYVNPEDDDPRRNAAILQQRLRQVQALIIFFGSVSEQWVRARLAEAINIVVAEGCPVRFFGIYLGPPGNGKQNASFELPFIRLHVLDNRERFDPATLEPVLGALAAAGR
jgi:hypothetical protein